MAIRDRNFAVDDDLDESSVIKVSGSADPQGISITISKMLYEHREAVVRCVGAAAVNQAVKAVAIARGYVAQRGLDLVVRPGFTNVPSSYDDLDVITAMVLRLSVR